MNVPLYASQGSRSENVFNSTIELRCMSALSSVGESHCVCFEQRKGTIVGVEPGSNAEGKRV